MNPTGWLVIGMGNLHRSDDAAGRWVARQLVADRVPGLLVHECGGELAGLLAAWANAQRVVVVDALQSGARPGTLRRWDPHAQTLPPGRFPCSTHDLGLAEAVDIARVLGQLPPQLVIYGIEGNRFTHGTALSPAVAVAVPRAAHRVRREIERHQA
ncbi:MAG: hydrogenase maturation protease [Verrucomicrobia bacterium]|nr:hydrogenase maturation protease [Verrucomicrobiota bacterium]